MRLLVVFIGMSFIKTIPKDAERALQKENEKRVKGEIPPLTHEDWGMMVIAPQALLGGNSCTDYSPRDDPDSGFDLIYGVKNRQDLIHELFLLITGQDEGRVLFHETREKVIGLPEKEFKKALKEIRRRNVTQEEKKAFIWQYKVMYHNINEAQSLKYFPTDYHTFIGNCLAGCRLKYITEAEAKAWANMLAPFFRETFSGWGDVWHSYVMNLWFFVGYDKELKQMEPTYRAIINVLLKEMCSPINTIRWDAPLPPVETFSFAEAVAGLNVKSASGRVMDVDEVNNIIRKHLNMAGS
ncbi:DUF1266 domain-containing protein [Xenorhabdus sp. PB62.4]|uniref:DUF1266 domain-containing protein n=1 Tax=Xenorhabdus sp. PB62.4 TaxID=1851573 RepID=UPI001CA38DE4|nr:DUF1266 domain-containing protein [Xenorhabdus sp. PB62.4]